MKTPIRIDLHVPAEHPSYEGHFPGNPLVPGALLLQWISAHACKAFNRQIGGVKQMKFLAPVRPNDDCSIEFNLLATGDEGGTVTIKVCCMRGASVICKGTLIANSEVVESPEG